MPSSIVIKNLSWHTADGHPLFSKLDLAFGPGRTGLVGDNGSGKSTLLRLMAGSLTPSSGSIRHRGRVATMRQTAPAKSTVTEIFGIAQERERLWRIETGLATGDDLDRADWTLETRLDDCLRQVGLDGLPPDRTVGDLSGGERTRVLLAALLFGAPDIILLDEPTNNLDGVGRAAVAQVLSHWHGAAVVASHDRALLDRMDVIVELSGSGTRSYGGGWTAYREQKTAELQAAEHRRDVAERTLHALDRQAQVQRERQARRDSVGKRNRSRGDQPKMLLNAMRQRAEQTGASQTRMNDRRRAAAAEEAEEARSLIEVRQPLSMRLQPTGLPAGKTLVEADRLTGGPDAANPVIRDVSFTIVGPERVAVTGRNGAGKTSLLRLLTGDLAPISGDAAIHGTMAMLDQHMTLLEPAATIRDNFLRLNPGADENACRSALARFLFRADAALRTVATLSGGEVLRAALAAVLGSPTPPQLLMLDEPTNHLDLRAIDALEAGLCAYDGALLVISHDTVFLETIGVTRRIALAGENRS